MRAVLLAAVLLACAPCAALARHPCWPEGSTSVARSKRARIYVMPKADRTYGCLYRLGRSFQLAGDEDDGTYSYAFRPFEFAGPYVAFNWVWKPMEPYDPGSHRVVVVDLRDGRAKHSMGAWGGNGPRTSEEGFDPVVVRLRLRADGAAAWVSDERGDREVRRVDSRGGHRLDHGRRIPGKSLRIDRHRVHWTSDGVAKHASLR